MYGTLSFPPGVMQPTLVSVDPDVPTEIQLPNGDTKTIKFRTTTWEVRGGLYFVAHRAGYTPTGILRLQVVHVYAHQETSSSRQRHEDIFGH